MWTLVTGASGFVGSHVVNRLVENGIPVIAHCRKLRSNFPLPSVDTDKYRLRTSDLSAELDIELPISNCIHCAATVVLPETDSRDFATGNVEAAEGVLRILDKHNVKNIILMSSISVYGRSIGRELSEESDKVNLNPYGLSKLLVEQMFECFSDKCNVTAIRSPGILGANCNPIWISKLAEQLNRGDEVTLSNPESLFNNFIYVEDLTDLIIKFLEIETENGFHAVNIAAKPELTISEIAQTLHMKLHSTSHFKYLKTANQPDCIQICAEKIPNQFKLRTPLEMLGNYIDDIKGTL